MRYGTPFWLEERVKLPAVAGPVTPPTSDKVDVGVAGATVRLDIGAIEFRVEPPPDVITPAYPRSVTAVFAPPDTDRTLTADALIGSGWPQLSADVHGPGTYTIDWSMVPEGEYDVALIPLLPD
jgi:hypothetical protein